MAVQTFVDAGIDLVVEHPHTSHVCTPLDVAVFKALKDAFKSAISVARSQNLPITKNTISKYIKEAVAAATAITIDPVSGKRTSNVTAGFEKCGIWPVNRAKITPEMTALGDSIIAKAQAAVAGNKRERDDGEEAPDADEEGVLTTARQEEEVDVDDDAEPAPAAPAAPVNPLSPAELAKKADEILKDPEMASRRFAAIAKPGSRARQATVLTGLEWRALEVAKADTKQKLEEEKAARKATRKANSGRGSEAGAGGGARSRAQAPVPAAAAAAAAEVDLVDDDDSSAEEPADIADYNARRAAFDSAAMETAAGRKIRIRWPAGDGADGGKSFLVKNVSHFEEFKWITQ